MFNSFVRLLNSKGVMETVTDGDCFFDTLHKITGLYTRRGWRTLLAKRMLNKKAFSVHEYKAYIHSKIWADYDVVFEAVRTLNRPLCVVQLETPNAVMWIRPDKVKVKRKDILYLVYDHGSHFTSFIDPITPPDLLKRLNALEKTGMQEDEPGLVVTHGNLRDLLYAPVNLGPVNLEPVNLAPVKDVPVNLEPVNLEPVNLEPVNLGPVKETNIEQWMKQYEANRSVKGTIVKGTIKGKTRKKPLSKKRELNNIILKTNSAYADARRTRKKYSTKV